MPVTALQMRLFLIVTVLLASALSNSSQIEAPLSDRFSKLELGMSIQKAERVLGPSRLEFPLIDGPFHTLDINEPHIQGKQDRYWNDEFGVVEVWFAKDVLA